MICGKISDNQLVFNRSVLTSSTSQQDSIFKDVCLNSVENLVMYVLRIQTKDASESVSEVLPLLLIVLFSDSLSLINQLKLYYQPFAKCLKAQENQCSTYCNFISTLLIAMKMVFNFAIQTHQKAYKCSFSNLDVEKVAEGGPPDTPPWRVFQTTGGDKNYCWGGQKNSYTTNTTGANNSIYFSVND